MLHKITYTNTMDEVFKYQESITNPMRRENDKFGELDLRHNLDDVISKARDYQQKLVNIKRSMLMMRDKTSKLKRRTHKLLEDKIREDIEKQRTKERREILEKHLEPVVNTKHNE